MKFKYYLATTPEQVRCHEIFRANKEKVLFLDPTDENNRYLLNAKKLDAILAKEKISEATRHQFMVDMCEVLAALQSGDE